MANGAVSCQTLLYIYKAKEAWRQSKDLEFNEEEAQVWAEFRSFLDEIQHTAHLQSRLEPFLKNKKLIFKTLLTGTEPSDWARAIAACITENSAEVKSDVYRDSTLVLQFDSFVNQRGEGTEYYAALHCALEDLSNMGCLTQEDVRLFVQYFRLKEYDFNCPFEEYWRRRAEQSQSHGFTMSWLIESGALPIDKDSAMWRIQCLSEQQYADLHCIRQHLSANVEGNTKSREPGQPISGNHGRDYDGAARCWDICLTKLASPDRDLVERTGQFLCSRQFTHWAEYRGGFEAVRTLIRLTKWARSLPPEFRGLLFLDSYFVEPYKTLHSEYSKTSDSKFQWLSLMQLGSYYQGTGRIREMEEVCGQVVNELQSALGPKDPLTLQARFNAAYPRLFKGQIGEAHKTYSDVAKLYGQVDPEMEQRFSSLFYQGRAEYMMNRRSEALGTISIAMYGFLSKQGPKCTGYLMCWIWHAYIRAVPGDIKSSIDNLESVCNIYEDQYGPGDTFEISVRLLLGNLYRILGDHDKAIYHTERGLQFRRQFLPISDLGAVDPAISLAIAYRDAGRAEKADDVLSELERHGKLEDKSRLRRLCQVKYLRSLLLFDRGDTVGAIQLLQTLLTDCEPNRELMLARVDLASMLRLNGDHQAASSIFDNLLERRGDTGNRRDRPRELTKAEEALGRIREGNFDAAENLLRAEGLRWVEEKDLWMTPGTPGADTTVMKLIGELD